MVPVKPVTFTVDVTVGVPVAEIVTGTLVLVNVAQLAVVKENVLEAAAVPQAVLAVTLQ